MELEAGFTPAVTYAPFQAPPDNVLRGGGPTGEACLPLSKLDQAADAYKMFDAREATKIVLTL